MDWDYLEVRVRRIANGFLVTESKGVDYKTARSDELFYPAMAGVEAELLVRLKAAASLDMKTAEQDF